MNSINGRAYKDDPTIFGWDLINEPRCFQCGDGLREWVSEMAAFVKSIDPHHLLTGETLKIQAPLEDRMILLLFNGLDTFSSGTVCLLELEVRTFVSTLCILCLSCSW